MEAVGIGAFLIGLLTLIGCVLAILYFWYVFVYWALAIGVVWKAVVTGCSWTTFWRCVLNVVLAACFTISFFLVSLWAAELILINLGALI